MIAEAGEGRRPCPCGANPARCRAPFQPDTLYMHDNGEVFCGANLPSSAADFPRQYAELGRMDAAGRVVLDGITWRCELARYRRLDRGRS